jgi:hypothetical protein
MIILRIHDLIYYWYTSSTLVEAPTSSLIGTYRMEDLAYMYEDSPCFGIDAWLVHFLGTSDDTCLVHIYMAYAR